jgi:DNA-binding MarR family transcriptional regulator
MIRETTDVLSAHELADALRPILLRLTRELRRETEELGVTSRQATLLWLIHRDPGCAPRDLARWEGITGPSLSGHLDRLEAAGLVERVRSTEDRRRVGITLTADGERTLRRIRARRTTWLATRLDALEDGERAEITEALPALRRLLEGEAR